MVLNDQNIAEIIEAGRTRWKIENENNNTLKTKGYNFKHHFGHGKEHISSLLSSLIILAFYTHTLLEFFDDLRAITRYIKFDSWQKLMIFMLNGLKILIQPLI